VVPRPLLMVFSTRLPCSNIALEAGDVQTIMGAGLAESRRLGRAFDPVPAMVKPMCPRQRALPGRRACLQRLTTSILEHRPAMSRRQQFPIHGVSSQARGLIDNSLRLSSGIQSDYYCVLMRSMPRGLDDIQVMSGALPPEPVGYPIQGASIIATASSVGDATFGPRIPSMARAWTPTAFTRRWRRICGSAQ